jgi:hypothetical protein
MVIADAAVRVRLRCVPVGALGRVEFLRRRMVVHYVAESYARWIVAQSIEFTGPLAVGGSVWRCARWP